MAAGDIVKIGKNAIFKGDDRYAPGSEVPASRFTKAELEMFTENGSLTMKAATKAAPKRKPAKASAPKESGSKSEADTKEESK